MRWRRVLGIGFGVMVVGQMVVVAIGASHGDERPTPGTAAQTDAPSQTAAEAPQPALSGNVVEACKAAIALMNSRDAATFTGYKIDEATAHVVWRSPDSGKRWQARCKVLDATHLKWAAFDAFGDGKQGRWRNEDAITATIKNGQITIDLDQSGVIKKRKTYSISKLA